MIRTLSSVFAAALLGACAAPAPAGPKPRDAADPALPASAFIDSAGLHRALLAAPPAPPEVKIPPLFRVQYDSAGALESVEALSERGSPAEFRLRMTELLRAHAKPRLASSRNTVQTVQLQSGTDATVSVLKNFVALPPELRNRSVVAGALNAAVERHRTRRIDLAGARLTASVTLRVSDEGLPVNPFLARSTGDMEIDRELLNVARMMRFAPGRVNGTPVNVLVTVPLTLQFESEGRPLGSELP